MEKATNAKTTKQRVTSKPGKARCRTNRCRTKKVILEAAAAVGDEKLKRAVLECLRSELARKAETKLHYRMCFFIPRSIIV